MPDAPARPPVNRPLAALRHLVRRTDDFVVVLVLLTGTYVLYSASAHGVVRVIGTALYTFAFVVAFRAAEPTHRQRVAMTVTFLAAVVVVGLAFAFLSTEDATGVAEVFVTAMLIVTLVSVLQRVLRHPRVTLQSIAGALSAYLLLGMTFSALFTVVAWLGPHPFFVGGGNENIRSFQYFSFTTLTTTGYGDLSPQSPAGRGLANIEALTGQIFLATLVAALVASYRVRPLRRRRAQTVAPDDAATAGEPPADPERPSGPGQ